MISFRVLSDGFATRDYGPFSPAIENLAGKIAQRGGQFEVIDLTGGYHRLYISAVIDGPTGQYECELGLEAATSEIHSIHRAIERLVAKAATRLMIR